MNNCLHQKVLCRICGDVIIQCRCFQPNKTITFGTCKKCAMDNDPSIIDRVEQNNQWFIDAFNLIAQRVHETAVEKGWWSDIETGERTDRNDGEIFANFHCEISEAWQGWRDGDPPSEKITGFGEIEEELADTIIRIMDFAHARNFDVAGAIIAKHGYNQKRPFRHGGKLA